MSEFNLSRKKFWLRDYDLNSVQKQVRDGNHDDCIVMWKDVKEAVETLKEEIKMKDTKLLASFNQGRIISSDFRQHRFEVQEKIDELIGDNLSDVNVLEDEGQ